MKSMFLIFTLVLAISLTAQPVSAACAPSNPNCNPPPPPPPGAIAISPTVFCVPESGGHYLYIVTPNGIKTTPIISGSCR